MFKRNIQRDSNAYAFDNELREQQIPAIVVKCVTAIEKHGKPLKGIYRISGVKSSVEKLCHSFQCEPEYVDLRDTQPNVIANVLKLYFRQLPEPLLTFPLYNDFIRVARKYPTSRHTGNVNVNDEQQIADDLKEVAAKLPRVNYKTLAFLMHHLKRISESPENNMPASNLGIVFGPTLLRTKEDDFSALTSLMDTVHQTRIVELLITFARQVFGPSPFDSDDDVKPQSTPLLRGGKHVDFASIRETRAASDGFMETVNLSGQTVVTSRTTTPTKQSLSELRRQFFSTPYSPPRFNSLPLSTPIVSSITTSSSNIISNALTKHNLKRTSSSSQLTTHANNLIAQELRQSTSSQAIRLIDDEDDS